MNENEHLSQFHGQCSILMRESAYEDFYRNRPVVGRPPDQHDPLGSNYVSTPEAIDAAIKESNGDIAKLESTLGLNKGDLGNGAIVRVDINNPEEYGLRVATGKESGANVNFNTKVDENGNLPDIKYSQIKDASGNDKWVVDTNKTDPAELAKINGQYTDQNGTYHPPKLEGYDYKTSGGQPEAIINQVPNTPENVSYIRIDGFNRGENGDLKTSKIDNGHYNGDTPNKINSQTVAAESGGGARAPNGEAGNTTTKPAERGTKSSQEDNSPTNKASSSKRGQKPFSTEGEVQSKDAERGQKPSEGENKSQGNTSTPRGERPQEAPQNTSNASQTRRGTPPGSTGGEDSKAPTSSSSNPNDKVSASSNSAKAADEASKIASDRASQNVAPKPNGMGM